MGVCPALCQVALRPDWLPQQFGLHHIHDRFAKTQTKILFAYGMKDPWHTLGVGLLNLSAELPVVVIPDGSHCADMAAAESYDTKTMLVARAQEEAILDQWLTK